MSKTTLSTLQVAERFMELAREEKWFEIEEELFSDDVKSIEPSDSPYLTIQVEGKPNVRRKGEEWVKRIEDVHNRSTSQPVVAGDHFAVARAVDITVKGHGRIKINQIMLYEVKNGQIVQEQFFYKA